MRAKKAQIREVAPDRKYGSVPVAKLINYVMISGKKSVAETSVYAALEEAGRQSKQKPLEVFEAAMKAVTPDMEVRSRRVGGASYQVPMPVKPHRGQILALRWLVEEANKRPNKQFHTFTEKLVAEMLAAIAGEGGAMARKETAHKAADANKAFSHFRW